MEITYGDMIINTYEAFKTELDGEFKKSADGFCKIGYLLKVARDTDILKESGYQDVNEFALKRYGLDKTQVSRFMNINDRFSVNGYSDVLEERYQNMGYSKLAVMLTLPDEINEEISPDLSKSEIKAIKDEYEEEKKVTDIEIAIEAVETGESSDSTLIKAIKVLGESDPELYADVWKSLKHGDDVIEALAPDGNKMYSIRIPGVGRVLLNITEEYGGTITNMRTGEKEIFDFNDLENAWCGIIDLELTAEESYNKNFDSIFPKKEKVAPVQPKNEPKKEPRKEKKVQKAAVKKPENGINTRSEGDFDNLENNQPETVKNQPETVIKEPETVAEKVETVAEKVKTDKISELTENETENTEVESSKNGINTRSEGDFRSSQISIAPITEYIHQLNEIWNAYLEQQRYGIDGSSQKLPLMLHIVESIKIELEKARNE